MLGYRELCKGYTNRRLEPVNSLTEFQETVQKFLRDNPNEELYYSLYILDETAKDYYDSHNNSIKDWDGVAKTKELVFDFDDKENVDNAKQDAAALIEKLKVESKLEKISDCVRVYFSGNKGFHVHILTDTWFTSEEVKAICYGLAKDLKTFDTTIYNKTRIFRIPKSRHAETGLYKSEFLPVVLKKDMGMIKGYAEHIFEINREYSTIKDTSFLDKYKTTDTTEARSVKVDIAETKEGLRGMDDIDFSECPKTMPRCIYALSKGIFIPGRGERHKIYLGLGNYYRNQGFSKTVVKNILEGINADNLKLYPEATCYKEQIKSQTIPMVFGKDGKVNTGGWGIDPKDELFKCYCSSLSTIRKCPIHHVDRYQTVVRIDEVSNSFADYAGNYDKNIVKTGIEFIDTHVELMRGTTNLLVGCSGTGKSTILLDIMERANINGMSTYFASLDMHRHAIYMKLALKLTNYKKHEIYQFFKYRSKYQKEIMEIQQAIAKNYSSTFFDFSSVVSLDDLKERIIKVEDENETEIKLVAVDYASRLAGPYSDSNANESFNALKIKEVADDTNTAIIIVNQVARANGDGSTPLRSKRVAKGSSSWEESCSAMVTCWRPYLSMDGRTNPANGQEFHDDIIRLFIAKNRMGSELERPLWWNGAKSEIRDMTYNEYEDYRRDREADELEAQKAKYNKS